MPAGASGGQRREAGQALTLASGRGVGSGGRQRGVGGAVDEGVTREEPKAAGWRRRRLDRVREADVASS